MAVLCKLADPEAYQPFDWDTRSDPAELEYWLGLFESHPATIEPYIRNDGLAGERFEERWVEFCEAYAAGLAERRRNPDAFPGLNTLELCRYRRSMLERFGWPDPYRELKRRENAMAVELYPATVGLADWMLKKAQPKPRWKSLMTGLFAGNMFDMGAPETIEMYERGEMQFASILERIPKRPWFIDDADALIERLEAGAYRRALIFVDNSGTDIVLGVMPLVREFARRGMPVVMAANSTAALNDITIDELNGLLEVLSTKDPVLSELVAKGSITTVPSGTGLPLIDLSEVGDDCNRVARDCDLVVLEGMGRGVESNWRQTFNCDVWRVALIKDACVAKWLGCKLFVPVCRFE